MFCMFSLCKKPPVPLHTPSTPTTPSGASTGVTDSAYSFQTCSTDPDSDFVGYRVSVTGRDTTGWTQWMNSGDTFVFSLSFHEPDTYAIKVQARDRDDSISAWSDAHLVAISRGPNRPPLTPDSFWVVSVQLTAESCRGRAFPIDPDSDAVACRWDWGDGDTSSWGALGRAPGYFRSPPHSYGLAGSYPARVQVKDTWGLLSDWTQPKTVVVNDPDFPWREARMYLMPIGAQSIVMHPSGDRYFVVGGGAGVAAISVTGDTALGIALIPNVNVQSNCPLAMSSDGAYLYVVSYDDGRLWRIRTSDMALTDSAAVGVSAFGVAVSPDGEHVYVTTFYGALKVVRTSDMTVEHSIGLEDGVRDVVVNPSGQYVYVTCYYNGPSKLYVVRTSDYAIETVFSATTTMCVSPDGAYLYTGNYDNTVKVIRTSDHTITTSVTLTAPADYLAVTPDGRYVYLKGSFYNSEDCCFLRTSDNAVRGYVDLQWDRIAFAPDGQTAFCVDGYYTTVYTR
jgi:DNA-binding beta-propeller fold protein YncE